MNWAEFSDSLRTRFVPRSLRDGHRDQFTHLEQRTMIGSEYEARLQELSRYATSILPTEEEHIH